MVESGAALDRVRMAEAQQVRRDFLPVLSWFWLVRGYTPEGRRRLAEILALPATAIPTIPRAWLLSRAGDRARQQGDLVAADTHFRESLAMSRELNDKDGE